jgi:hypothetical protein
MDSCCVYSDRFARFWWEFSTIDECRYATSVGLETRLEAKDYKQLIRGMIETYCIELFQKLRV